MREAPREKLMDIWTIAVKRSVLYAAIALESEYGDEALNFAEGRLDRAQAPEERLRSNEVWRYLMAWNCMGTNDKVELLILPE